MIVDLHSHTTASDGDLSPMALLQRASRQGVDVLSITDHDTVDGLLALDTDTAGVELVHGVELSCIWGKRLIHVVGLNIDLGSQSLRRELGQQQQSRQQRAQLIAEKLEKYGFTGAYDYVLALADGGQIGRPHFARFLVEHGHVDSEKQAFKKYLGAGKPGDIKVTWPSMADAVQWIVNGGGVAVLAHPHHYKLTATKLNALTRDFRAAGGSAVEVISGNQPRDKTRSLVQLVERFELMASIGSDFHRPGQPWNELGQMGTLPDSCRPVWSVWS